MDINLSKEFVYRIQEKDTIESLCKKFNTCKENILRNNDSLNLYAGELVNIVVNDFQIHIVKPAETLNEIVNKYNIDAVRLKQDNNLVSEKLYIGQMLKIYHK